MNFRIIDDVSQNPTLVTSIKVIGVGGGGSNAVDRMIEDGMVHVDFIAMNTDTQALNSSFVPKKLALGTELTGGLGAGGNPGVGEKAALEDRDAIREILDGSDMVFITAGMGGGTGTGAAPIIAEITRELGILSVGVVTSPFHFEGAQKMKLANEGIKKLRSNVDTLITISNQRLLQIVQKSSSIADAFRVADTALRQGVQGISDLIVKRGMINIDFADVKTIMKSQGDALMGIGYGEGEGRAINAALEAINNPILEGISIEGATGLLVNVSGGNSFTLAEYEQVVEAITANADINAMIIAGNEIDSSLEDKVKVTVIATGFSSQKEEKEESSPTENVQDNLRLDEWKGLISSETPEEDLFSNIEEDSTFDIPAVFRLRKTRGESHA